MKKLIALLAVLIIVTVAFTACKSISEVPSVPDSTAANESTSEIFFIQYRIYAPENSTVTLDGKEVPYNENIDCYEARLNRQGAYTLTVTHEGCETIEDKVNITTANNEYTANMVYSDGHLKEAQETATLFIEDLMKKCWSLDYTLDEYNFSSEEEKLQAEAVLADAVSALQENLSAEYTVGEINISTALSLSNNADKPIGSNENDGALFFSFDTQYSYTWQFKADSYEDSGEITRKHKPHIIIEKIGGEWCIKSFYISLDNGSM